MAECCCVVQVDVWTHFSHHYDHCIDSPVGDSLNDATAGTGTSTTDWIQLVVGEGGVVDWVFPGWRGEYKQEKTS